MAQRMTSSDNPMPPSYMNLPVSDEDKSLSSVGRKSRASLKRRTPSQLAITPLNEDLMVPSVSSEIWIEREESEWVLKVGEDYRWSTFRSSNRERLTWIPR